MTKPLPEHWGETEMPEWDVEARPPAFSDEDLALRFAGQHAHDLRYVAPWAKWLHWTAPLWRIDDRLLAFNFARAVCRFASAECNKKNAASLASAKTVAAVEKLAKADHRLAASLDQWDANPDIMNTKGHRP